jgi:putative tryptophan/tyrosine transport system substrate-binding protein
VAGGGAGTAPAIPVIGYLSPADARPSGMALQKAPTPGSAALLQGLKEAGYVGNVAFEYRFAENQVDRLPALAADLVRRRVSVILAAGATAALAVKAATATIPIVFFAGGDPVAMGLVASLNRPGANVTGIASLQAELSPKRLQLLHYLIPNAGRFGVLADPPVFQNTPSIITDLQAAARTLYLPLIVVNARTESDLETAFASFSEQRVGAVLVAPSASFSPRREQLVALAARHALPTIFPLREYALAGGLMS